MKRAAGKMKQMISILLAVAMVVTCIPQTGLSVLAAENEQGNEMYAAAMELDQQDDSSQEETGVDGSDEPAADITQPEDGTDDSDEAAGGVTVLAEGDDGSTGGSDGNTDGDGGTTSTSYAVTVVAAEEQVTVEAEETVQENAAYSFTAAAKEGYEVESVKAYQTLDYTENKDNPEELANYEIELAVTDTEGKKQYTIAENVIAWDITIVVTSQAVDVPAEYVVTTVADLEQVTVEAAGTVQENAEYSFTAAAKAGFAILDVRVYKTADYEANRDNPDSLAAFAIPVTKADTETEGRKQYTIAADTVREAITIVIISDVAGTPAEYAVTTVADLEQVTVEAAETVQENAEYSFTVAAREGYEIQDVKVYTDYEANKDNPDSLAALAIPVTEADTETEGKKQYTIAADTIQRAITIVVISDVKVVEPSTYDVTVVADTEQVTVEAAETAQGNAAYSFTAAAKEGFEIKNVKAYQTLDYTANKDNPEELANHEIELTVAGTEGEKQYTIAENVIAWDITIVVTSQAKVTGAEECTVLVEYPVRQVKGVMYAVGDSDKFRRYTTAGIEAHKGQKLQIKVSQVIRGYVAYVAEANGEKAYIGPDGIYTMIPSADNEIVRIEAEGEGNKEFAVTCEIIGATEEEKEAFSVSFAGTRSKTDPITVLANGGMSMTARTKLPAERRIKRVSYQIGTYEESFELTDNMRQAGGTFKIPVSRITGDIKFIIELGDTPKHKITFDYDNKRTQINLSTAGLALDEDGSVEVLDGSYAAKRFAFRPMMTEQGAKFKIKKVTADGVVLNPGEETGQYYLRNISAPITVEVVIGLDEDKCNNLSLEAGGHKDAFAALITGFVEGDDDYAVGGGLELTAGGKTLTQADTLHAAVQIKEGYQIDRAELDGKTLQAVSQAGGQNVYDISFDGKENAKKTLKVYTSPIPTDAAKTVRFSRMEDSVGVEAKETELVVKTGDDNYELKAGATYFDFTVTVDDSEYEPRVQYENVDGSSVNADFISRDGNEYQYSLAANRLPEYATVAVSKETVYQTVKVSYDKTEVWIESARIGSGQIEGTEERDGMSYQVPRGKLVSIRVNALDNCQIVSAGTTIAGEMKQETVSASGFTFYVTADTDCVTQIESQGSYNARPLQEAGGSELIPVNGVYNVSCYKGYRGGALHGTTEVYHDRVEVKINGREVSDDDGSTGIEIQDESTAFYLGLSDAVAGKTIEVNLYVSVWNEDKEQDEEIRVAAYKLKAGPAVTKAAVEGIPASGFKDQPLNTVMSYKITPNPATADLSAMKLTVEGDSSSIRAELTEGTLQITTGETAGEKAQIKLYMDDDSESGERVLSQFTVTAAKQLEGKKPEVSLKLAGDVSLRLAVSAPAGTVKPAVGKLYYKVTATPKDGTGKPDKVKAVTEYVEKTDETVQTVTLRVNDEAEGLGQPWNFDVAVELIQTGGELLVNGSNEAQVSIDRTTAYQNTFATRKAYYEDKLKLKKAKTTIVTGQENVVVATAQFGKDTTFTEITARDITYPGDSEYKLQVETDDDGRVIVSAPVEGYWGGAYNPKTGKHRIEVIAASTESMYASRATMDVTVVRGIDSLQLGVSSTSLYKADKKTATIKVTALFNEGAFGYAPKSKKLTWEIVDADQNALTAGHPLYGMVTVKNGTVTVKKNYGVSTVKSNNQFRVKATAADYPNNKVTAYSDVITITNEAMTIGGVAVVRYADNGIEVIAGNTLPVTEVEAKDLGEAFVVALAAGAPDKDRYTWAEFDQYALWDNISYKSSNAKAVALYDGWIRVLKPVKNLKLTAAAEDGGKAKKEMAITIKYDAKAKLGLEISRYNIDKQDYEHFSDPNKKEAEFTDTAATRFRLELRRWVIDGENEEEGHWDSIPDYTNYKLDVKGAKVINKYSGGAEIVMNSEEAVITVTDNNVAPKVKTVYKLTNKGFITGAAPKVTLDSIVDTDGMRETTGQFKDNSISDYSKYVAKVEVDWTAANAKNYNDLYWLEIQMEPRGYFTPKADGSFVLKFCDPYSGYSTIKAGKYKLKATLGEVDANGNFKPVRKAASVTLKVVKSKMPSFKMTLSYTISPEDSDYVTLTGKGNYEHVYFSELKNANVKGVENHFLDYFELGEDNRLQLKADWEKNGAEPTAADLTGYVTYDAVNFIPHAADEYGPYWANSVSGTVKITVKWK